MKACVLFFLSLFSLFIILTQACFGVDMNMKILENLKMNFLNILGS
jgi:hypothetical protein